MPVNNILSSSLSSPVDLYTANQSNVRSPGNGSQEGKTTERVSQKEEVFTVQVSTEARERQRIDDAKQAEFDQKLEAEGKVKEQKGEDVQKQRAEAQDYAEQRSIDIIV